VSLWCLHGRTYAAFVAGLALWLVAEVLFFIFNKKKARRIWQEKNR
jgi:hypothetical protein